MAGHSSHESSCGRVLNNSRIRMVQPMMGGVLMVRGVWQLAAANSTRPAVMIVTTKTAMI